MTDHLDPAGLNGAMRPSHLFISGIMGLHPVEACIPFYHRGHHLYDPAGTPLELVCYDPLYFRPTFTEVPHYDPQDPTLLDIRMIPIGWGPAQVTQSTAQFPQNAPSHGMTAEGPGLSLPGAAPLLSAPHTTSHRAGPTDTESVMPGSMLAEVHSGNDAHSTYKGHDGSHRPGLNPRATTFVTQAASEASKSLTSPQKLNPRARIFTPQTSAQGLHNSDRGLDSRQSSKQLNPKAPAFVAGASTGLSAFEYGTVQDPQYPWRQYSLNPAGPHQLEQPLDASAADTLYVQPCLIHGNGCDGHSMHELTQADYLQIGLGDQYPMAHAQRGQNGAMIDWETLYGEEYGKMQGKPYTPKKYKRRGGNKKGYNKH